MIGILHKRLESFYTIDYNRRLMLRTLSNYFSFTVNFHFKNTSFPLIYTLLFTYFLEVIHFDVATLRGDYNLEV